MAIQADTATGGMAWHGMEWLSRRIRLLAEWLRTEWNGYRTDTATGGMVQLDRDLKGLSTPAAWWQLQALNLGYSDPEDGTIETKHTSSNGGNGIYI